ncbi:MAG: ARMT1-like domain-containing protein [bacterium]
MKTFFDCIPCFVRQSLDAVRMVSDDPTVQEGVLREVLRLAAEMDLKESPPSMGQRIHRLIRKIGGDPDPYRAVKERCNQFAFELLPWARQKVAESDNPFEVAVRLAVAGNILDFGVHPELREESAKNVIHETLSVPIDLNVVHQLQTEIEQAESILYVGDNAGEIVFDRVLIEQMPLDRVTSVVRGAPAINDATMNDAVVSGLTELVEVIDNGSDAPGTILADCSPQMQERFRSADLIIAKGQGNYETLNDERGPIWFLLKAKCPVIARNIGCPVGSVNIIRQEESDECSTERSKFSCQEEATVDEVSLNRR